MLKSIFFLNFFYQKSCENFERADKPDIQKLKNFGEIMTCAQNHLYFLSFKSSLIPIV